jgi:hypothetical protein
VADILGNSSEIVERHYAKWPTKHQDRIDNLAQTMDQDAWKRGVQGGESSNSMV